MGDPQQDDMQALIAAQTQLLQTMATQMTNMHNQINHQQQQIQHQQQQQQVQQQPRDKHREFMSHKPPNFSHAPDPLEADDWLKTIGKMLTISQCNDREKVLYAAGHLTGSAGDWWDAYVAAHANADTITWDEFTAAFRQHHIPIGIMQQKKKEFLALKQRGMSVAQYRDMFIQLSRYAPDEVADDARKQAIFMDGLAGPLQCLLLAHTFDSFQQLVDKAIVLEFKRAELGEQKRKAVSQGAPGSGSRPRYSPYQQGTPFRPGGQGGGFGQQSPRPMLQFQRSGPQTPRPGFQQFRPALTGASPVRPISSGAPVGNACFKCGEVGHYANNCPKRGSPVTPAPGSGAQRQGQHSGGGERIDGPRGG